MWLKATAGQTPQTDRCRIPYRTPNRSGRQEPMVSRIYVEKKPGFDVEAQQLKGELTEILGLKGIEALRIINRYDVEGIDEELFRSCVPTVFSEPPGRCDLRRAPRKRWRRLCRRIPAWPV